MCVCMGVCIYMFIVALMLFSSERRVCNPCRWVVWVFLCWPSITVVLYSFVHVLLHSIESVNINHVPRGVCKFIDLNPKYMEQFARLLASILCKVIAFSRIRKLSGKPLILSMIETRPIWWLTCLFTLQIYIPSHYVQDNRDIKVMKTSPYLELPVWGIGVEGD